MGFDPNPYDLCVFNKMVEGYQVTIAFHVDDLLITSVCEISIKKIIKELESEFEGVTVNNGRNVSHTWE